VQVEDTHGFRMEEPHDISFRVQVDERPRVFLPRFLKQDMPFTADKLKLFTFGARLQDDFGVSRCVLTWRKSTIENPSRVTQKGEVERLMVPPRTSARQVFENVFESLSVRAGDRVSFNLAVYDNRAPRKQRSTSPTASLFIHQEKLEDLRLAGFGFGRGGVRRARVGKAKRATTVRQPAGTRGVEEYENPHDAGIDTATVAPRVGGVHARTVKDYFRLMSTVTVEEDEE
jgi:hypothetical protein